MALKDMREKLLEDYNDVFSDIFNGLLFEENVIEQQSSRLYLIFPTLHGKTKTVFMILQRFPKSLNHLCRIIKSKCLI